MRTFTNPARVAVVNKPSLKERFNSTDNGLMHQPIFNRSLMNFALLWIVNGEGLVGLMPVCPGAERLVQRGNTGLKMLGVQRYVGSRFFTTREFLPRLI